MFDETDKPAVSSNIPPAEGNKLTDVKALTLQETNKSLDDFSADELDKELERVSQGPVSTDNETRKLDVAYRLRNKR